MGQCIKILMDLDLSYENGGMHFILYVTHMSGNICKMSKYIGSDSTIMQNHINHCFSYIMHMTTYEWTLPKNVDGFGLPIPKLKDNTLFYMPDRFLEAFVKFQIYWQWQVHALWKIL